jgi:hypothetical protein
MLKLANHTALKEWSNVVAALASGKQVILIRKGGIADPSFGVDAERFYLYPTYFHQGEQESRPSIAITHWCEVVRTWTTSDPALLARLAPLVALPQETLDARYRFRPDQALYVIGVRTWELAQPAAVRYRDAYGGCRSWVSVDEEIGVDGSSPVVSEDELQAKLDEIAVILRREDAAGSSVAAEDPSLRTR